MQTFVSPHSPAPNEMYRHIARVGRKETHSARQFNIPSPRIAHKHSLDVCVQVRDGLPQVHVERDGGGEAAQAREPFTEGRARHGARRGCERLPDFHRARGQSDFRARGDCCGGLGAVEARRRRFERLSGPEGGGKLSSVHVTLICLGQAASRMCLAPNDSGVAQNAGGEDRWRQTRKIGIPRGLRARGRQAGRARLARGGDAMNSVGLSPSTRRPFGYPSNKHKLEPPPGPRPPAKLSSRSTQSHTEHQDIHKIAIEYTTEAIRSSRFATKLHISGLG